MSTSKDAKSSQVIVGAALYQHCGICNIEQDLRRCAGCKVIRYCSKEHQSTDWATHKSACTKIRKRNIELDQEEDALHSVPVDDPFIRGDPFITGVGHFWGLFHTRDYMRARFAVVEALLKLNTLDAVESAYDHLIDMLRLCRGDNMGVRDLVPALLLRLGRDQDCYDFIKWWATTGLESDYDWGDTSLPYLDLKDADIFEPVDYLCRDYLGLSHVVAATLLKIRQLVDLKKGLLNLTVLREKGSVPLEIFDSIQDSLLSSVLGKSWDDLSASQRSQLEDTLSSQVDTLYDAVERANRHFWPAVLKPRGHLEARPEAFSHGSKAEMQLVLQYSMASWRETPGALEVIKEKS